MRMKILGLVLVSVAAIVFANGCGDKGATTAAGNVRCSLKADAAVALEKACKQQTAGAAEASKKCEAVLGCAEENDAYAAATCKFDKQKVKSSDCTNITVKADCEKFGAPVSVCEYK